jgi:hypothetical protein
MPPFSSSAEIDLVDRDMRPQTGFTSGLMDTILVSKSNLQRWGEFEKAKADTVAESYRQNLMQEQASIDSQVTSLLAVQMERGLNVHSDDSNIESNIDDDQSESLANRKKALEGQQAELETETMKLQTEHQKREKRVLGE